MPPNVLLIVTDQQFAGAMSCAGNPYLHTPAMDALAARGTRFDQTYCAHPICIPARESLLTGRMPFQIGYREWGDPIDERYRDRQLGPLFREAGYDAVYGGKVHAPGGDPAEHGFRGLCPHDDDRLADACIDYLERGRREPFCMVASFDNPHNICEWARNQRLPWGPIAERPLADCPPLPANFGVPPFEPQPIRRIQANAPMVYPGADFTPEDWRRYRSAYYRLVEKVDAEIGRLLERLAELGLRERTLVVFTSDHGDGHGAHQWNQKSLLYEETARVPMIVSPPGGVGAGRVEAARLVSNGLDVLPTLCDYAGMAAPDDLPGRSLRPLCEGADIAWRDELFAEARPFQGDPGRTLARMARTRRYKYVVFSWGKHREQLFDLRADPGEMSNLAVSSAHADVLDEHRRRLRDWCARTGDEFLPHAVPPAGG